MPSGKPSPLGDDHAAVRRRRLEDAQYREVAQSIASYEGLARLVIRYRMANRLSQRQLAELVGTSHSAISRIEKGQHRPSVDTLERLARAFDRRLVFGFVEPSEALSQDPVAVQIGEGRNEAELVALP